MRFFRSLLLCALVAVMYGAPMSPMIVGAQEPQAQSAAQQRLVESVDIQGNRRQRDEDLRFYIQTREGEPYNPALVQKDLEALLALPFFDKTETRALTRDGARGGVEVIFEVRELPIIRDLQFKGLKAVTEADVLKAFRENRIGVSKESVLDPVKVNNSKRLLRELLAAKGYPNAKIEVATDDVSLTSTAVTFNIDQGERVRVVEIDFEGNTIFSDDKLRDQMKYVKEAGLVSRFKGEDILDTRKLEADLFNVTNYMRSKGYLQARASEPRIEGVGQKRTGFFIPLPLISSTDDALKVTIPVTEGKIFRVGTVKVEGNSIISGERISAILGILPGEIADGQRLGKALNEDLKRAYGSAGFIQYEPDTDPAFRDNPNNPNEGIVDFTITINEGRQFTVRRIEFQGNTFTRDNVLRRQVLINEGDVYNEINFENSILRLNQSGYFDPIDKDRDKDIRTNEETGEVDLTVRVAERGRQQISFNGGVSGIGGSFFGLEYSTNNFLGRGEILSLNFAFGNRQRSLYFTFTQPSFRNREISAGFTLFAESAKFLGQGTFFSNNLDAINSTFNQIDFANLDDENLFTSNRTGGSLFLSAPLSEFRRRTRFNLLSRIGLSYSLTRTSLTEPTVNQEGDAARFIPSIYTQPNIITSRVTPSFTYSSVVRNGVDGINGKEFSMSMAFAGLGGDVRTYQPFATYTQFMPVRRTRSNNPEVFAYRLLAGHVSSFGLTDAIRNSNSLGFVNGIPFNERFFLGDEYTIRGYDVRRIAPIVQSDTFITSNNVVLARNAAGTPIPYEGGTAEDTATLQELARRYGSFGGVNDTTNLNVGTGLSRIGGDTQLLGNFEYRIPIFGPVSLAAFADIGSAFNLRTGADQLLNSEFLGDDVFLPTVGSVVLRNSSLPPGGALFGTSLNRLAISRSAAATNGEQLAVSRADFNALLISGNTVLTEGELATRYPSGDIPLGIPPGLDQAFLRGNVQANTVVRVSQAQFAKISNYRASLGAEARVQVPVVNVPFRLIFAYNPNARINLGERKRAFRFSIGRTF